MAFNGMSTTLQAEEINKNKIWEDRRANGDKRTTIENFIFSCT